MTKTTATLTARSPEDVLAAVPLVLGFMPEESVVMLTFGAEHPFHARLDLPRSARERRAAAEALVDPAVRHRVRRVLFVLYAVDAALARSCARALVRAFTRRGVAVVDVLRSDGRCWFVVPLDPTGSESAGTPYDVTGHLFTAQSVAAGRVTRSSRDELAASVAPDLPAAAAVAAAARELEQDAPPDLAWVRATVDRWGAGVDPPDPATAARLLVALRDRAARDAVLDAVDREGADQRLPLWSGAGPGRADRPAGAGRVGPGLPCVAGGRRRAGVVRARARRRGGAVVQPGRRGRRGARAGAAPEPVAPAMSAGGLPRPAPGRALPRRAHPP